jgi:hypothetical protein
VSKKCYSCKGKATLTTYWGRTGHRYLVPVCVKCKQSMAESDRNLSRLLKGFSAYCDAKGR